jgi:RNA polymerase-binding transcription factor DksA
VSDSEDQQAPEEAYWLLVAQKHRLIRLRADLQETVRDDSERWDAAKLARLEAAAQLDGVESRLEATEQALRRYAAGKFGRCVACGGAIPAERLEARLEADLCLPCCERQR